MNRAEWRISKLSARGWPRIFRVSTKRKIRVILTQRIIKAPEFLVHLIIARETDFAIFKATYIFRSELFRSSLFNLIVATHDVI